MDYQNFFCFLHVSVRLCLNKQKELLLSAQGNMSKKTKICIIVALIPLAVKADDYLSHSRQHAPAPISPNITKDDNTINKEPEETEVDLIWRGVESSF
ncbi:hypothetical protein MD535_01805 [Vibrio sp. ZSDZ65]|uniref:Uncharacterized protein n=1 Tax=Vibrio qingdaonensis TaxID=2829491 RepID=A0A9X3CK44_9VIBR|nr:hypothetical protein [Vibrio qingdaonensis]MCW8344761.1 hypothetical protein [Vibrio qingdaonensis]